MTSQKTTVGILVGGGPAPGINSVIGAATIRSILGGCDVIGLLNGFEWLIQGNTSHVRPLSIEEPPSFSWRLIAWDLAGESHQESGASRPCRVDLEPARCHQADHDWRRRHGVFGAETRGEGGGSSSDRACPQNDRQRLGPPARYSNLWVSDRTPYWRGNCEESDGGRPNNHSLVFRCDHGPQSRPSGARDRKSSRCDADSHSRRISPTASEAGETGRFAGGG